MKYILLLFVLLYSQTSSAQIVLTSSSYTSTFAGKVDTFPNVTVATIPASTKGTNQLWDFSSVTSAASTYDTCLHLPTGTTFTTAQYSRNLVDPIGYYNIPCTVAGGINVNGVVAYGTHFNKQVISIDSITSNTLDTMTIYEQDVVFSKPQRKISFPTSYLKTWGDTVSAVILGKVTAPVVSMHDAPLEIHITYSEQDTITGWGTMKVKNSKGGIANVKVLQVKSVVNRVDSTFINGTFLSTTLKHYFWLPDGWVSSSYKYVYYTANEVAPIADVDYDYYYTTPLGAKVLNKNYPTDGILLIDNKPQISVFPNPVTDHTLFVSASGNIGSLDYKIIDMQGKIMAKATLNGNAINAIKLPDIIAPGIYYLQVNNGTQQVSMEGIIVR
ncbi:MAG: Por secretion system C-terminal sorting protein [Flavipsychrobacter sp.]|nr:Por secretion system C-terminal sorting protein [Flavipsychrobacter sp.]